MSMLGKINEERVNQERIAAEERQKKYKMVISKLIECQCNAHFLSVYLERILGIGCSRRPSS